MNTSKFVPVSEFLENVAEVAANNWDVTPVAPKSITFSPTERTSISFASNEGSLFATAMHVAPMEEWAEQQIWERLLGPDYGWIGDRNRAPDELYAHIGNYLANYRTVEPLLLRMRGMDEPKVRAVLSSQYRVFDGNDLVNVLNHAAAIRNSNAVVARGQIGDHTSGYVLLPDITFGEDPRNSGGNRDLHPCVYFASNEIGRGGIRVNPGLYTGVCSNGLIWGWRDNQDVDALFLRHRWSSRAIMEAMIADVVSKAFVFSEKLTKMYLDSYTIEISKKADEDFAATMLRWGQKYNLSAAETAKWQTATEKEAEGGPIRLGDVINGITWLAHGTDSALHKEELEVAGGSLLAQFFSKNYQPVAAPLQHAFA